MNRYLTELIGTFFLVFTIGMVVVAGSAAAPIAIGTVLMVMVYMGGHVSGAHYNPAVTIAVHLRGALAASDVVPYIVAQLVGAWVAAGVVQLLTGDTFAPAPGADFGSIEALIGEVLVTFALVLVILNVATAKATHGNSYYGLAIGFTVLTGAYSVGPSRGARSIRRSASARSSSTPSRATVDSATSGSTSSAPSSVASRRCRCSSSRTGRLPRAERRSHACRSPDPSFDAWV